MLNRKKGKNTSQPENKVVSPTVSNSSVNATFLLLDSTDSTQRSAEALQKANKFGRKAKGPHRFYNGENAFDTCKNIDDLETVVCVGHSGSDGEKVIQVGVFNPQQFAEKFAREFTQKFPNPQDKLKVKDLYLICCEAGFVNKNEPSIAEHISNQMVAKGFSNVKVHAIAPPRDPNATAMIVTIVSQGGKTSETGALHVRVFKKIGNIDQFKKYQEFERGVANRTIRANDADRIIFMQTVDTPYYNEPDVKTIYDQPENTIQPNPRVAQEVQRHPVNESSHSGNKQTSTLIKTTPLTLSGTVGALMAFADQLEKEHAENVKNSFCCFMFLLSTRKIDKARELRAVATSLKSLNSQPNITSNDIKAHIEKSIKGKTGTLYKHGILGIFGTCRTKKLIQSIENSTLDNYISTSGLVITEQNKRLDMTIQESKNLFRPKKQ